jgi:hypothetical protein
MNQPAPVISEILSRIDSLVEKRPDLSRTKLSKRLFGSGHALEHLRAGKRDPQLRTVQRALTTLDELESERAPPKRRRN